MTPQIDTNEILRWSTTTVPPADRLEYFASAISEAIVPIGVERADVNEFHTSISMVRLEGIEVCTLTGPPHRAMRGPREFARTLDRRFTFAMLRDCNWKVDHRGQAEVKSGAILCHDSSYPFCADIGVGFTAISVSVTEQWLGRWLPDLGILAGRIAGESPWGAALSAYLAALRPESLATPVLPSSIVADQFGGLLALVASDFRAGEGPRLDRVARSLHDRIVDCIAQRCTEPKLDAANVAASCNVSLRTLHRTLAKAKTTFGTALIAARVRVAERMLTSPSFARVTTAEVGRRAGFLSASHFARVMVRYTGQTPSQLHNGKT